MNLALTAVVVITFVLGLVTGALIVYAHEQSFIDWLINDYEKQLTVNREAIARLDATLSERKRAIHCTPIERGSHDWEELTFMGRTVKEDDIDFPNSRGNK